MLWSGLCASASSVFRGYEWISVASPVFVSWLLIRVSNGWLNSRTLKLGFADTS